MVAWLNRSIGTAAPARTSAAESAGETPFLLFTARSPLLSPESKKQTANLSVSSSGFPRPTPRRFWGNLTFADPKKANSDRLSTLDDFSPASSPRRPPKPRRRPAYHGERGDTSKPAPRRQGQSARPRTLALPRRLPLRRGAQRSHAGSPRTNPPTPMKARIPACGDNHATLILSCLDVLPAPDVSLTSNPASSPRLNQCLLHRLTQNRLSRS